MITPHPLLRPLARAYFALRYRVLDHRHRRLVLEQVDGVKLIVLPEVFNPVLLRTGVFLAQHIPSGSGRALDMGAGSGIGTIFAARRGWHAVGVDINPEAVRCARINVLLNRVEDRAEIRGGDLFGPVAGQEFDLVLFNPPFFRGLPRDAADRAWRGTDVLERFAAGLPNALAPGGQALLVFSTDGDWLGMLAALDAHSFAAAPLAARDVGNEVLTVYAVTRR